MSEKCTEETLKGQPCKNSRAKGKGDRCAVHYKQMSPSQSQDQPQVKIDEKCSVIKGEKSVETTKKEKQYMKGEDCHYHTQESSLSQLETVNQPESQDERCTATIKRENRQCKYPKVEGKEGLCTRHYNEKYPDQTQNINKLQNKTNERKCIGKTRDGKDCPNFKKNEDLCDYHYNKKKNRVKTDEKRCIRRSREDNQCAHPRVHGNLCTQHYNIKKKKQSLPQCTGTVKKTGERCKRRGKCNVHKQETIIQQEDNSEFKNCKCKDHNSWSCGKPIYAPVSDYINKKGIIYKRCKYCRNYLNKIRKNKKRRLQKERERRKGGQFGVCTAEQHNLASKFSHDCVPKSMLEKKGENGEQYDGCRDCREYKTVINDISHKKREVEAEEQGKLLCGCGNSFLKEDMAMRKDGTPGKKCLRCKENEKIWSIRRREQKINVLKERIFSMGCSCKRCKTIFLKGDIVKEISTFEENGKLYLEYEGIKYSTDEFLKKYEDLLELSILEMDHLTEKEQRDQGLLKEGEPFIDKICLVCEFSNIVDMKKEAKKCQLICSRCHIIVTDSRNKRINYKEKYTGEKLEKCKYVEDVKKGGCVKCGYYNENILRFLELDHIVEKFEKVESLSDMVQKTCYILDDVKEEIKKCQVLCRFCHKLRTDAQRLEESNEDEEDDYDEEDEDDNDKDNEEDDNEDEDNEDEDNEDEDEDNEDEDNEDEDNEDEDND